LRSYKVEKHEPLALAKSSVNEFDDLNTSLEELTDRTYQTYVSQKEFTENASHEMQTPLAVFQSKLELLMQTSPLNEEQAQLIADLADATQRMARLNKNLVLLTKIENYQFTEKETVSLNSIVENFIQQYQPQSDQKQITINKDLHNEVKVEANKTLIEILVSNLLGNAIRHNCPNGFIKIALQRDTLTIQNTGKPFSLNGHKLFRRFQKESSDSNSIGLGLEMVKKIASLYQFSVSYDFNDQMHNFIVKFSYH
jgi:signal transduction histidine kinase